MKHILYQSTFFLLIAILAFILQSQLFLNGDVVSLLHDANLFLAGGSYIKDTFETNPPMIFLLYSPVLFFYKWTAISLEVVFRVYTILLIFGSLTTCAILLDRIIAKTDQIIKYIILISLLAVFLFLPHYQFGQREHYFVILFSPYIFLTILRIQNKPINAVLACIIGIIAGLSIGMKPYFLAPWILIELYLMWVKHNYLGWVRIEFLACLLVLLVYFSSVFILYPEYFSILLPLISHLYHIGIKMSWLDIFLNKRVLFCGFVLLLGLYFNFKIKKYREVYVVLQLVLLGMIIAFLIPRAPWFYHVLPALCIACVLLNLYIAEFFAEYIKNKSISLKELTACVVMGLMMSFSLSIEGYQYAYRFAKKSTLKDVMAYIESDPAIRSIYCFSSYTTGDCFALVHQTQREFGGRFPFFWWIRGLRRLERTHVIGNIDESVDISANHIELPEYIARDKNYVFNALADDLNFKKPDLIVIDYVTMQQIHGKAFRYEDYFSQNSNFKAAWQHYKYFKTLGHYELYKRVSCKRSRLV